MVLAADDVEPALGGALLALLRHEAAAWGRWRSAMASISSVAAISKLSGPVSSRLSRAMSASEMWRRSSRRCAVMPSAPGRDGQVRGAQRVGMAAAAGVADGRDVVDVDAEAQGGSVHKGVLA